jgi:TatD DNase family protein
MLVDSHAHISYFPTEEWQGVINRATENGVLFINNISTQVSKFHEVLTSCLGLENIFCTVGTHPCHVQDEPNITAEMLINLAKKHKEIIGFGETGLDYFHSTEHKTLQIAKFEEHIAAAVEIQMPIIVHTRNADDDTLEILTKHKKQHGDKLKVLIHCFTGGEDFCQKLLNIGCYISFSGIVTFKNAKEIQKAMHCVPMEKILIETDSPYLAPEPHRGKKNEPAFVKHVAEFIAMERGLTFEQVAQQTTQNFCQLFGINANT